MEIKDRLVKELLKLEDARMQSGNTEVVINCPFCGVKHRKPKFYIEIDDDAHMFYHCFSADCPNPSGVMTPDVLHLLGIENIEFDMYLNSLKNKSSNSKIKSKSSVYNNYIIPTEPRDEDIEKINYSSNRTGVDFTKSENIEAYKLIYNLKEFLKINDIELELFDNKFKNEKYIDDISKHWIGFLSYNNNILNMRNVNSPIFDRRYMNIKIKKTGSYSFLYMPPQDIDLLTTVPRIVLTEGAYDIICVKNRFFNQDTDNVIFGAVGSASSYTRGLMKMFQISCFFDADIDIYGDQDVNIDEYYKKFSKIIKNNKIRIIRNKNHKDFGNINESYSLDIKTLN